MCGICGFTGQGSFSDVTAMTRKLEHRGPDDSGFWKDELKGVYLGHTRLSIIDIAGGGQPMKSADKSLIVVFNGEIYNFKKLRVKLVEKGHIFKTHHSDTEVLLHGYREWGYDLPTHLNGMWAFAIYDVEKQTLFLSRDRFGKKPLFYTFQNNTLVFSSELSSLTRHSSITASLSHLGLKKYFAYGYIPGSNSMYANIYKLPGGHNLSFHLSTRELCVWKYWDFVLEPFDVVPKDPVAEWGDRILDLLEKAVRRRLMSDVPLGVFLSGGIDSSAVTAFASRHVSAGNLKTFSIGFTEASFNESEYAKMVSELFHTNHHEKILSMEKAKSMLPSIAARLDEPMGDSSLLPTFLLCKEARKKVTVALGGDGGDELFAGYDPFQALKLAQLYKKIVPKPIHKGIRMLIGRLPVSHKNMSLDFKLKRTLRGLSYDKPLWNSVWLGPLEPLELAELFSEPLNLEEVYSEAIACWDECKQPDLVDKTLQFYTRLYLQDDILVKADRASMMNSLEVRAPFLDIDLVDFVRKVPYRWKFRQGQTKYILKKALERVLPKTILYRPKKGFGAPVAKWFQDGFLSISPSCNSAGLSNRFICNSFADHMGRKADNRAFLWNYWLLRNHGG